LNSPLHSQARQTCWKVMEKLISEGKILNAGVSNYEIKHLQQMTTYAKVRPKINQIELHPLIYQTQLALITYCRTNHIQIEAYMPLGSGRSELLHNPLLASMAKTCKKSISEILLQWSFQHGFIPIVKSTSHMHLKENLAVSERWRMECDHPGTQWKLNEEQMRTLDELERTAGTKRMAWNPPPAAYS